MQKTKKKNSFNVLVMKLKQLFTTLYIYTSKQTFKKHFDLILLSDSKNSYYVLIKSSNRFMTNKTKHYDNNIFVDILYNASQIQKC